MHDRRDFRRRPNWARPFTQGMAVLVQFGLFWPGILILLGVVALLSPELRGHRAF